MFGPDDNVDYICAKGWFITHAIAALLSSQSLSRLWNVDAD